MGSVAIAAHVPMQKTAVEKKPVRGMTGLAFWMERVLEECDRASVGFAADPVHDLRVAIRRFSQSLRAFASFFPQKERRKIRRVLRHFMKLSGKVRNLDIALDLLESHQAAVPAVLDRFRMQKEQAERELADSLRRWAQTGYSSRWRAGLLL